MTKDSSKQGLGDPIVVVLTIGFIVAFLGLSLWNMTAVADLISAGFAWTANSESNVATASYPGAAKLTKNY